MDYSTHTSAMEEEQYSKAVTVSFDFNAPFDMIFVVNFR